MGACVFYCRTGSFIHNPEVLLRDDAGPITKFFSHLVCLKINVSQWEFQVCVFYYCRTYYKAVRVGGGGEWRTCAMRDDESRPVWMSLLITH